MKTKDETYEMILEVYKRDVPLQSEIANPFSANKRQRRKTLVSKPPDGLPEDVNTWNSRNFVDYFAEQYHKHFSGTYKKTYSSDCSFINQIFDFMEANELNRNEYTKKFIDWSFINSQIITSKNGVFLLGTIKNHLNGFFQQGVLDTREKSVQIDIFHDISNLVLKGKTREVFITYGIPLAATFFVNHKNIPLKNVIAGLQQLFTTFSNGDNEQKMYIATVIQRSISRGPYIDGFELVDWRDVFKEVVSSFKTELWYREEDFSGKPQYKLEKFLNDK